MGAVRSVQERCGLPWYADAARVRSGSMVWVEVGPVRARRVRQGYVRTGLVRKDRDT